MLRYGLAGILLVLGGVFQELYVECAEVKFLVTAPSVIHFGQEEQVFITLFEEGRQGSVEFSLQDERGDKKFKTTVTAKDEPTSATLLIKPEDVDPPRNGESQFLYLAVESKTPGLEMTTHQRQRILLSHKGLLVFLQTDKPVYTTRQTVKMRGYVMDQNSNLKEETIRVDIKNPQDVIVNREELFSSGGLFSPKDFVLPPIVGNWSVVASYGHQFNQKMEVKFEVKEYVLPDFEVILSVDKEFILSSDNMIRGKVGARYFYGEQVKGTAKLEFGIAHTDEERIDVLGKLPPIEIDEYTPVTEIWRLSNFKDTLLKDLTFDDVLGKQLFIKATIYEKSSGKSQTAISRSSLFANTPYKFDFERSSRYFKPGLPYEFAVKMRYANGKPAGKEEIEILVTYTDNQGNKNERERVTRETDDGGFLVDEITILRNIKKIEIKVKSPAATETHEVTAMESSSFLRIKPSKGYDIEAGLNQVEITVTNSDGIKGFYYMVLAHGQIKNPGFKETDAGTQTVIDVMIPKNAAPLARLIVYYKTNDNKIIIDSVLLNIKEKCSNEFEISIADDEVRPGRSARIDIVADSGGPGTTVSLLSVDEAVFAVNDKERLTRKKFFSSLRKTDLGCTAGSGRNSAGVFEDAGIAVIHNLNMESTNPREEEKCHEFHGRKKRSTSSGADLSMDQCCRLGVDSKNIENSRSCRALVFNFHGASACRNMFYKCCKNATEPTLPQRKMHHRGQSGLSNDDNNDFDFDFSDIDESIEPMARTHFPETWLFNVYDIPESGRLRLPPMRVPHSITTWNLQAIGMSPNSGICVSQPAALKVMQRFFIRLDLPYSAVVGEQLPIRATVFNYGDENLPVNIYMMGIADVCSGAEPGKRTKMKRYRIGAQDSHTFTWPIIPLKVPATGKIKIIIKAFSSGGSDKIEKDLYIVNKGKQKTRQIASFQLDPAGKLEIKNQEGEIVKRKKRSITVSLPHAEDAVLGTESCSLSLSGQLLSASKDVILYDIEKFLRIPTGCGEQNMIYTAPNVYVGKFLKSLGKLQEDGNLENKVYELIQQGVTRQLYFRNQGGFSVWTKHEKSAHKGNYAPSTWLTAFVVKVFGQAREFSSTLKEDPSNIICSAVQWLETKQNDEGVFTENYKVYHQEMIGDVKNGDISLTAFVLIAILESGCKDPAVTGIIEKSRQHLEQHLDDLERPYHVALVAYALAKSESYRKIEAFQKLKGLSKFNAATGKRAWLVSDALIGSGKPYKASALAVETTSYALLTTLLLDDNAYANSIVTWLLSQRDRHGAFKSTQDTVMALQALSQYMIQTGTLQTELTCNIQGTNGRIADNVMINDGNADVVKDFEVTNHLGGELFVDVTDSSQGILYADINSVYYSVDDDTGQSFELSVTSTEKELPPPVVHENQFPLAGGKELGRTITVCTKYQEEKDTLMSVIQVDLGTGFKADEDSLKKLTDNTDTTLVDSYEQYGRGYAFYLSKIPYDQTHCISFDVEQEFDVGNLQPVLAKVFRYDNPQEEFSEVFYHPKGGNPELSTLCTDNEEVCQCAQSECGHCWGFGDNYKAPKNFDALNDFVCSNVEIDYVYIVRVRSVTDEKPFKKISTKMDKILKKGYDDVTKKKRREFLVQNGIDCPCPNFEVGKKYLIAGKDTLKYQADNKNRVKYLIDENTYVTETLKGSDINEPAAAAMRDQYYQQLRFINFMEEQGCNT